MIIVAHHFPSGVGSGVHSISKAGLLAKRTVRLSAWSIAASRLSSAAEHPQQKDDHSQVQPNRTEDQAVGDECLREGLAQPEVPIVSHADGLNARGGIVTEAGRSQPTARGGAA